MTSIRSKISHAVSGSPTTSPRNSVDLDGGVNHETDKYRLLVTAGPSYDTSTHKIVHVNTDTPTFIENEFLRAKLKVRIRGYRGLPASCPNSSPYFDDPAHEKDQYSIAFSFVPKKNLPGDAIWGNDFDHPVRERLPPGFNTAFKIVKDFIDPGLECDAYADKPWLYGPALSCWFGFHVGDNIPAEGEIPQGSEANDIVKEGADGSGEDIRAKHGLPKNSEKRRKHFLSRSHREQFIFEKDRLYSADFYNPYLDFGNFSLKLPGFSIKVIKYIDDKSHTLRYVFKNGKTGEVYLCVNLNLLWGEQLQKAMKDNDGQSRFAGAEVDGDTAKTVNGTAETHRDTVETTNKTMDNVDDQDEHRGSAKTGNGTSETRSDTALTTDKTMNDVHNQGERREVVPAEDVFPDLRHRTHGDGDSNAGDAPGMKDKPNKLRAEIERTSISELLQQTSTSDRSGNKAGGVLDELD
ncbi:hypothetical protein LTR37_005704 [Vermiconidia calcicola]|uniref:Uncharacterized protein n=1 Tax=Vermiconidia calcicola TaxID=1690605 RepID=A0ACC3NK54_9PEZI|nr:hypothetical protein LTR37_005704 [Vermiconidia calcicola]